MFYKSLTFVAFIGVISFYSPAFAELQTDLDSQREELISALGSGVIPEPQDITTRAERIFAQPVLDQNATELEELANDANKFANLISRILDEYTKHDRENSRFSFVQEQLEPFRLEYAVRRNRFLNIRNQAYLNLGKIYEEQGDSLKAFFFYNDALRLSVFGCSSPDSTEDDCIRLAAERGMLRILNMEELESYVRWKR